MIAACCCHASVLPRRLHVGGMALPAACWRFVGRACVSHGGEPGAGARGPIPDLIDRPADARA